MSGRKRRRGKSARQRIGRVSVYLHHGSWWIYYLDGHRQIRRRVGDDSAEAERVAAQVNAELTAEMRTHLAFSPISVSELRRRFLVYHEEVLRSTVNTIRRYRAATQHLEDFAENFGHIHAHDLIVTQFVTFLRQREISPNGHPHTPKRLLRDKGVRYILEVCRGMYNFAGRMRFLPPYFTNPFADLRLEHIRIDDAKPIFVFDAETELAFFRAADAWAFPLHFCLAKTGLRPGELVHLIIEDVDLESGWLQIRNRPELGWRIKTGCQRCVPLIAEVVTVLREVIGDRSAGPVFLKPHCQLEPPTLVNLNAEQLVRHVRERQVAEEAILGRAPTREELLRIARTVWRDAGAVRVDAVRISFMRIAAAIGHAHATCAKSWRHSFATLLQDANVDPLIRQITLGHKPSISGSALGMTSHYTHTRPETQKSEIERALRLWPETLRLALANKEVTND